MIHDDYFDTLVLARGHLDNAASLFRAIASLLDSGNPDAVRHARRIASLAHDDADMAADDFGTLATMIEHERRGGGV